MAGRLHTREDSGLVLDRHLAWWHDGERIEHPNIIEAFNQGLRIDETGRYRLELGGDWCFIQVEACAFGVVAVDESDGERLSVRLSDRTAEWLDATTLSLDDEGVLTVRVKDGRGTALFSRDAQTDFAQRLEVRDGAVVLRVGSRTWPTGLPVSALDG